MSVTFTLCDIETVDFRGGILEISAIKINEWLKEVERLEVRTKLIWPKNHVSGYINHEIGLYSEKEAVEILKNFVHKDIMILWNASFELRMFAKVGYGPTFLDLMKVTKDAFPGLPSYALQKVAESFGILADKKHRATGDCETMLEILGQFKKHNLALNI